VLLRLCGLLHDSTIVLEIRRACSIEGLYPSYQWQVPYLASAVLHDSRWAWSDLGMHMNQP